MLRLNSMKIKEEQLPVFLINMIKNLRLVGLYGYTWLLSQWFDDSVENEQVVASYLTPNERNNYFERLRYKLSLSWSHFVQRQPNSQSYIWFNTENPKMNRPFNTPISTTRMRNLHFPPGTCFFGKW